MLKLEISIRPSLFLSTLWVQYEKKQQKNKGEANLNMCHRYRSFLKQYGKTCHYIFATKTFFLIIWQEIRNPADASGTPDLCLCQVISQLMVSINLLVSMTGARTELPVLQTWKVARYHRGQQKANVFLFVFLQMKVLWQRCSHSSIFTHTLNLHDKVKES